MRGESDTRLARYRAALDVGTDPAAVSAGIAEVQAERLAAEIELDRRPEGKAAACLPTARRARGITSTS